eukprot:TRINITY_DN8576_c0_g1_i1.p1 TRINITY_DN8576_c0_g1~~TRINITY_DN8576_c0_g1_i1.p1  ORF type:complete len:330 (-),score=65.48 TRINITY_DN8576_c0_g1_i1:141-1130(-)
MNSSKQPAEHAVSTYLKTVPSYIWVVTWVSLNITLTLLNKAIFQFADFKCPVTLSAVHMLTSSIFTTISIRQLGWFPSKDLGPNGTKFMIQFAVIFMSNIVLGNMSLRYGTVSLVQVIRSTIPGMTMILSIFVLGKTYSREVAMTMLPICVGMMLTVKGDMSFTLAGGGITFFGCFLSAMKVVICNKFLVGDFKMHPLDLLDKTTPWAFLMLVPFIFVFGEWDEIMTKWETINFPYVISLLALSATNAFLLNVTNFFTNQTTGALVLSVSGNVKQCASIFISVLLFSEAINMMNGIGISITIIGTIWFNMVRYKEGMAEKAKAANDSKV